MTEPRRDPRERRRAALERRARRAEVSDPDVIMEAAAAFLAVRPRSVAETRRRLRHLGYPDGLSEQVVARLMTLGYLDDLNFARAWVESRDRARPRGNLALRQELLQKGVPRGTVDAVLAERAEAAGEAPDGVLEAGEVELQAADRLLARKASTLERETDLRRRRQRAYALLARHGFSPDVCQRVAARAAGVGEESPDESV